MLITWISAAKWMLLFLVVSPTQACRPEVCRKKRSPRRGGGNEVTLQLRGCSGQTPPWVAQVAFCLNISSFDAAIAMRDWYEQAYEDCRNDCDAVREGTTVTVDIELCVNCFEESFERSDVLDNFRNISAQDEVFPCVQQFVVPFLNEAVPSLQTMSSNGQGLNGRVNLPPPEARPEHWWALSVRLPCKPPLFQYVDANCINAFVDDDRARDFVLTQNRLITRDDIQFLVRFSDTCRFDPSDIEIVWDKSVPGFVFPQISSFPSSLSPTQEQFGHIFFDAESYMLYEENVVADLLRRKKRSPDSLSNPPAFGIEMPCQIRDFSVKNARGDEVIVRNKGTRYLIEPEVITQFRRRRMQIEDFNQLNFTLDFGFQSTGCVFASNEPYVIVDPPAGWLDARDPITCYTCQNAASESECRRRGEIKLCSPGEVCQSEMREMHNNRISITKTCKQANACSNNWIHNNRQQCYPGRHSSVCRCCCSQDRCNEDALHCT